jgi:type IV pilus assembly protein PilE
MKFTTSTLARRGGGFTLPEMLAVISIIGIMAAIAYPSYTSSVARANRAQAKSLLLQNAQFLERNYTVSNRYDMDSTGTAITTASMPYQQSPQSGAAKYTLDVQFPALDACTTGGTTQQCYTLSARPTGAMANDPCGTYQLTHNGAQTNTGIRGTMTTAECWQK